LLLVVSYVLVWLRKMILAQPDCTVHAHWLWKVQQCCALAEKSVINMAWLPLSVSHWLIILIGPDGLLLVFSHLFAVPILVFWIKLGKREVNN
jgi:hypothetical protein